MALGIVLGATIFPDRLANANSALTLASTGLLIFCMGADLGAREELIGQLANVGFSSVLLCAAPVALSIIAVYALTSIFMKDIVARHKQEALDNGKQNSFSEASHENGGEPTADVAISSNSGINSEAAMIAIAIGSLVVGIAYGLSPLALAPIDVIIANSDFVLYALMFFVGISVGRAKGLIQKIRDYGVRLLVVPAGIIVASFVSGLICAPLCGLSLGEAAAVTSGMGWYSLVGVVLADLAGAQVGSIAFLANLLRELVSFLIIPWIARHLNYPTCLAPAGATSEDTTLPMIIRCTNEETVVLGVINGIVCSAAAPVLVALCSQFM